MKKAERKDNPAMLTVSSSSGDSSSVRARVLWSLLSAVLGTACDKAKPDYERCEMLAQQRKFIAAREACKQARDKDPNSQSGRHAGAWIPALDIVCTDRAKPDYEQCQELERKQKFDEALAACGLAYAKDPDSESGKLAQAKIPVLGDAIRIEARRLIDELQSQTAECRRKYPKTYVCACQAGDPMCSCPPCDPPGGRVGGRPFLIEGRPRLALAARRADWSDVLIDLSHVEDVLSTRLSDEWTRMGLMEHASIAAFARFALQLMSLGAPPDLIDGATAAMADETRHARLCFAIASGYAGRPVGPGKLRVERSLCESSLVEIVLNTIREGCVGETVAAVEAGEAAEHAGDPAIRAALSAISRDESRHAALAWRFVRWALAQGDAALEAAVVAEFERIEADACRPRTVSLTLADRELLQHGVVPEALRRAIHAQTIAGLFVPCARALLADVPRDTVYGGLDVPGSGPHGRTAHAR